MGTRTVSIAASLFALSQVAGAQGVTPTYDVTGVWDFSGGGTLQYFQRNDRVDMVFVGPDYAHHFVATYSDATTFGGIEIRITRATGCKTHILQYIRVVTSDLLEGRGVALDSNCDLVKGQIITGTNTRIL